MKVGDKGIAEEGDETERCLGTWIYERKQERRNCRSDKPREATTGAENSGGSSGFGLRKLSSDFIYLFSCQWEGQKRVKRERRQLRVCVAWMGRSGQFLRQLRCAEEARWANATLCRYNDFRNPLFFF